MTLTRALSSVAAALALTLCASLAQAATQPLTPSRSGDDTAQLQAALSKCTNAAKPCDLKLGKGVFHTDVLLVKGFNGSITGSGEGKTIIRPLATRPLRSNPVPFFSEPTLAKPYPVLIHFANGAKVSLSKFTMEFPGSMRVAAWDCYLTQEVGIENSLLAAVMVDGVRNAELLMKNVTIIGTDNESFNGSNLYAAVRFEGQLRFTDTDDLTRKLQRGRFVALDNTILRSGNGISLEDVNNLDGLATGNEFDTRIYSLIFTNLSASKLVAVRNIFRAELEAIFVAQTPERPPQKASDYLLAQNIINVNENDNALGGEGAYDGIGVYDFIVNEDPTHGETFLANVAIVDNDITVRDDTTLGGITVSGDGKGLISILGNRIYGQPYGAGVYVDLSRGTLVAHNDLSEVNADVWLTASTRDCRVIEPGDTVLDDGTNNKVIGVLQSAPAAQSKAAGSSARKTASALQKLRARQASRPRG